MAYPSVYPTGTTIYDPNKCWNGYTIFPAKEVGALLIDMNGGEVKLWKGLHGMPNKILPGGDVMGNTGERNTTYGMQDHLDLVQVDWDGNISWKFNEYEYIEDPGEEPQWMARQHHDYQREGNPVGYYVPNMDPLVDQGNTLILSHKNLTNTEISDKPLIDDTIIEDGVRIDNLCMIAHNVEIGAHSALAAMTGIAGSAKIGKRCMFAGQSGVVGHIKICDDVIVSGQGMVSKDITEPGVYASSFPAEPVRAWNRSVARIRRLDKLSERVKKLERDST